VLNPDRSRRTVTEEQKLSRAKSAKDAKVDFDKKRMGGAFASLACKARQMFLTCFVK
jgi:hypothetical protein